MKPEAKNKAESLNLEEKVKELQAQLEKQALDNKSLVEKVESFDELKDIMPESHPGYAVCRRENNHPGLKFKEGEKYKCLKTVDVNKRILFVFKLIEKTTDEEGKEHKATFTYQYSPPQFYRFFNWVPKSGEEVSGEAFLKELRRKKGK